MKTRLLFLFSLSLALARAELRLPKLFSDHLVLQAGQATTCWGWAEPGAKITVQFVPAGKARNPSAARLAVAGADRRWSLTLPARAAGDAGSLEIVSSSGEQRTIADVLVGEVWLGSGQSNMAYRFDAPNITPEVQRVARAEAAAAKSAIRFFTTVRASPAEPQDDVGGVWVVVSAETIDKCSATAWNFAVALRRELQRPVGMIVSAVGNTPVEAWMSQATLDATKAGAAVGARHRENLAGYTPELMQRHKELDAVWLKANPTAEMRRANGSSRPRAPYTPESNHSPTRLYNGMIQGLVPYTLRGILWFQADGNNGHLEEYAELICAMIMSWRQQWHAELPFYYVEMNNMQAPQPNPVELAQLCLIREAQAAALQLPKTGVVAAIDVGIEDAHFPDKKPVGERLAALALADNYGRSGLVRSPEFAGSEFQADGRVRITLRYADGLRSKEGEVRGFAICAANGSWRWAQAKVDGTDVIVWNDEVKQPVAVRYAWARNPVISLVNTAGLPLRPFRTDVTSAQ